MESVHPTMDQLVQSGAAEEGRNQTSDASGACGGSGGGGGATPQPSGSASGSVEVTPPQNGQDCPDGPLASGLNQAVDYVTSGFDQEAKPTCPWAWAILLGTAWTILKNGR